MHTDRTEAHRLLADALDLLEHGMAAGALENARLPVEPLEAERRAAEVK